MYSIGVVDDRTLIKTYMFAYSLRLLVLLIFLIRSQRTG